MSSRKGSLLTGIVILGLGLSVTAYFWRSRLHHPNSPTIATPPQVVTSAPVAWVPKSARGDSTGLTMELQRLARDLMVTTNAASARTRLDDVLREVAQAPPKEAAAAIRRFLNSNQDARSYQGFKLDKQGYLVEAPTLRTTLLDYLERVDPAAAAEYSRTVLTSANSPDEWAVAMRSLARGDTSAEGRLLLEMKAGELLNRKEWQREPSTGYLEAFDVPVFLGGTNFVPALAELVRLQDNSALARAAYLALDRLVINDTATALAALETDLSLMQGRGQTRANYFARADVRDPAQKQVLEAYLLNPKLDANELETFSGIFPNANFMISNNLLTQNSTPDQNALKNRDMASLSAIDAWLAEPRYQRLQPQLAKTKSRLVEFVRQAGQQ